MTVMNNEREKGTIELLNQKSTQTFGEKRKLLLPGIIKSGYFQTNRNEEKQSRKNLSEGYGNYGKQICAAET